ncbi:MAG: hypothetical protein ACI9BK_001516, partial [Acidimicrobiales bacterium]
MTKSTSDETQGTPWQAFYDEARARLEAEGE